jgi:uncharacterized membrane protein
MPTLTTGLLWFAALGSALLGGVYFAFSAFIMRALRDAGHAGTVSMNAINRVIVRSSFMPLFIGTTLGAAALAVLGVMNFGHSNALLLIGGGVVHVAGMFGVTLFCNVPLNNALQNVVAESRTGTAIWNDYLRRWTRWNHLRAASSLAAATLFMLALLQR